MPRDKRLQDLAGLPEAPGGDREDNAYVPERATVLEARPIAPGINHFRLEFTDPVWRRDFSFCSGQFMQVSLLGVGEAPISICSPPTQKGSFELCVREAGNLTGALARLRGGDELWVRGPYGQGFPLADMGGQNLLFIGGGIGLAPLRSAIDCAVCLNDEFGDLTILHGARNPDLLLFEDEYDEWRRYARVETIVDEAAPGWQGNTGLITSLFDRLDLIPVHTSALICGPPVMYEAILRRLKEIGFDDSSIFVSLERHMRCGVGKCEHCVVESFYTCRQGPVLSLDKLKGISSALR